LQVLPVLIHEAWVLKIPGAVTGDQRSIFRGMIRRSIGWVVFLLGANLSAQVIIGYDPFQLSGKAVWELNDISYLKTTKTVFVLPFGLDSMRQNALRDVIAQRWKLTPFQITSPEGLMQLREVPGYSFFHLSRVIVNTRRAGTKMEWGRMFCWRFWTVRHFEQGLNVSVPLAFTMVQPDENSFNKFVGIDSMADRKTVLSFLHDSMDYPGVLPHIFGQQLSFLQQRLLHGDKVSHLKTFADKNQLKALKKKMLWCPIEYLGGTTVTMTPAPEKGEGFMDRLKKYKASYRLVALKELDDKIATGESLFYLQLVRNGYQWVVSVWEAPGSNLIYQRTYYEDNDFGPRTIIEDLNKAIP
jgi:hypothetical protein